MGVGGEKKSPFDPVSTNDPGSAGPPEIVVVKSPDPSSARVFAGPGRLFARVPIPRTTAPCREGAVPAARPGNATTMPLLSTGRSATGFWTWEDTGAAAPEVVDPFDEKYVPLRGSAAHAGPQSSANTPTHRMPFSEVGPVSGPVHDGGTAPNVESTTWIGTRTAGSCARTTSAVATGPQNAVPSANWTHSATLPPSDDGTFGSMTVRACLKRRRP